MILSLVLLLAASAFGQEVRLEMGAETPVDTSFGGISGLGIDATVSDLKFYAVSDDVRSDAASSDVNKNPRYFDGTMLFGSDGQTFTMTATPSVVFPIPRLQTEGQLNPEGFHFCGQYLYMANGASDVRRWAPSADGEQLSAPVVDGALYEAPEYYSAAKGDRIEGVAVAKDQRDPSGEVIPLLYSVSEGPIDRDSSLPNNPVSILEWNADSRSIQREFLIPQKDGERTLDMAWESGRRFVYMVAAGGSPGEFEEAAIPDSMRLYSCVLPAPNTQQDKNIMALRQGNQQITADNYLQRQLVAEFKLVASAQGGELFMVDQDGNRLEGEGTFVSFPAAGDAPLVVLPNFDGMAFGPDFQDGVRSLFFISDNNFDPKVPTRYVSLRYTPQ